MRKVIYSMFGLAVLLFASSCEKKVEQPDPTLTLSQTTISVSAEGGTSSVAYKVTNPREGAEASVEGLDVDWISNVEVSASNIDFVVAANEVSESRSVTATVSYPGAKPAEFTVVQEPYVVEYDYDFDLTSFSGTLYKEMYGNNGENNFYIWISDLPFDDNGNAQVGGNYYNLDFYADPALGDAIPAGTYVLGEAGETASMTFTPYTRYVNQREDGYSSINFSAGSIEVSIEGDIYTFEGTLTDTDGALHHISYTGPAEVELYEPEPEPVQDVLDEPLDIKASMAGASYYGDTDGVLCVAMQFTDMQVDDDNYVVPPGSLLTVEAYMPFNEDGTLTAGTYEVADTYESMTVTTGYDFFGLAYMGTYVQYMPDELNYLIGLVSSGTMQIDGDAASGYTITCDFTTAEGVSVKCSWSGMLSVAGMPGPCSTLTGDYTADFEGAEGNATYYGDYYMTGGGNWTISLERPSGETGDGVLIDLVAEGTDFSEGIPSGTYKAAASTYPAPGEYMVGSMDGSSLYPTMYVYFNEEGYCTEWAPATSGDIDITNNGDGTYDIVVECTDDLGYVWSGSWSGEIATIDASSSSGYSTASVGNSLRKGVSYMRGAQTPEAKAELMHSNGLKVSAPAEQVPAQAKLMSLHKVVR